MARSLNESRVNPEPSEAAVQQRDLVEGLAKGLRVIEAFDDAHPHLNATECAERCGLTRSAARRHLLTLVHLGYAATDGKRFWLAPRVLRLATSFLEAARLPRLVQPFLQQLAEATRETVNFSVLDGHEICYLARSNSPRQVSVGFERGARAPAHAVAPGPMLAGMLPEAELQSWVHRHKFTAFTANTVTDPALFAQSARHARVIGYCIWEQRFEAGFNGVSTAVTDRRGRCHGAIGMTLPVSSWNRADIEQRLVPALQDTAAAIRAVI